MLDSPIQNAVIDGDEIHFDELSALKQDAINCLAAADRLKKLNPTFAHEYDLQLAEVLREINEQATKLQGEK